MPVAPWTLISTDAALDRLSGLTLVLSSREEAEPVMIVLTVRLGRPARGFLTTTTRCTIRHARLGAAGRPRRSRVPAWMRLEDLTRERLAAGELEKALVVPGVRWGTSRFMDGLATAVTRDATSSGTYEPSQILARLNPAPSVGAAHSPEAARTRVAGVKARLGAMSADVLVRIEKSALFDARVPTTRHFQLLLLRWEDEHDSLGPTALEQLSREVQLAFETADDHASTVGLRHLPSTAQPVARRAMKAALLAKGASTEGERRAAAEHVRRLLDSLALYYLPASADLPAMIGPGPEVDT